jgi:putative ABC transport system permease protein
MVDHLAADVRFGLRMLRKTPGATSVAVLSLALGIGATTAIFTIINAVLLRPLPYREPASLVVLWERNLARNIPEFLVAPPNFKDWSDRSRSFSSVAALRPQPAILTGVGQPERLETARVSAGLFAQLGVAAVHGRTFLPEDGEPARSRVCVLSHGLWQRRFAGDRSVLGRTLTLDGVSYQIVGIAEPSFRLFDTPSELWMPYILDAKELGDRGFHTLKVVARLKPGVTAEQASSEMASIANQIAAEHPDLNANWGVKIVGLREQMVGAISNGLWILLGAVGILLLIACTNVAAILLMKAGTRQRELALRTTLGASHWRVIAQMLTESVVLSLVAAALGVLLAWWGTALAARTGPATVPQLRDLSIDSRVLLFAVALAIATGILFGFAPAISAIRTDLNTVLRSAGRSGMASIGWGRIRGALVVTELLLAQVLLIGAALLIRSLLHLERVELGFQPDHVLSLQLSLPATRYQNLAIAQFYERLLGRLDVIPGVEQAGAARDLPLTGTNPSLNFEIEGHPPAAPWEQPRARFRTASAGYFTAMRLPLLRGRFFDRTDSDKTAAVAIVNQTLAQREWPNQDPIGRRIRSGFDSSPWCTIVGIVGNVKHAGLDAANDAEVYYHYLQVAPALMPLVESTMTLVLRTRSTPTAVVGAVRDEVAALDKELAIYNVKTVAEIVADSVAQPRFRTWLLALFAGAALLLAAIGLYGLLAHSVAQRANELGVRAALGATARDLLHLIVSDGLRLALIGIGAGMLLGLALSRLLARLLFEIGPRDLVTFGVTPLVLLAIALLASLIPALRAARVDPADALRDQ